MEKNIQIYSVYNVQPRQMVALLKGIRGLRFSEPRVNDNGFCEVKIINGTARQWQTLMSLF